MTIKEDQDERMHLKNLSLVTAACEEDALNLLFVGDTNRMIAETPSNPSSSRSHCIFIISLTATKQGSDVVMRSKLHLVDLAGSERAAKTGIDGMLLREAKYINLSLHYLEQVIIALYEAGQGKRVHVPYRNSMMTSVLRDSLGGNCKTTMIATLAIEDELIDESISTCRFAQRVALISNSAVLNEELDPKMLIARLKSEIARLKAELKLIKGGGAAEGESSEVHEYEIDQLRRMIQEYMADTSPNAELVVDDFAKIQKAFQIFKSMSAGQPEPLAQLGDARQSNESKQIEIETAGLSSMQMEQFQKLKGLVSHRDNEISTCRLR